MLSRLASFLRRVADGEQPGAASCAGACVVVPAVNVLGVNMRTPRWPFDNTDINRMFPGYDAGETTQRIAAARLQLTPPAHYRVDVHSSNATSRSCRRCASTSRREEERAGRALFGLPAVIERARDADLHHHARHAWRARGGEASSSRRATPAPCSRAHCERLFRALVDFLDAEGMLSACALAERRRTCTTSARARPSR